MLQGLKKLLVDPKPENLDEWFAPVELREGSADRYIEIERCMQQLELRGVSAHAVAARLIANLEARVEKLERERDGSK